MLCCAVLCRAVQCSAAYAKKGGGWFLLERRFHGGREGCTVWEGGVVRLLAKKGSPVRSFVGSMREKRGCMLRWMDQWI